MRPARNDSREERGLQAGLMALNLDTDHTLWTSFRERRESRLSGTTVMASLSDVEKGDLGKWDERIKRSDVFGKDYVPSEAEGKEIAELAKLLDTPDKFITGLPTLPLQNSRPKRPSIVSVLRPPKGERRPILLKRGPVNLHTNEQTINTGCTSPPPHSPPSTAYMERELILLSTALIIASVSLPPSSSVHPEPPKSQQPWMPAALQTSLADTGKILTDAGKTIISAVTLNKVQLMQRNFESCHYLSSILAIMDLAICSPISLRIQPNNNNSMQNNTITNSNTDNSFSDDDDDEKEYDGYDEFAFRIVMQDRILNVDCTSVEHKDAWIRALRASVIGQRRRDGLATNEVGWKHEIMRCSIYSAALLGDVDMLEKLIEDNHKIKLDAKDDSGYSALHYATLKRRHACLVVLLDRGSDPNDRGPDGKTSVDYASQLGDKRALSMFSSNGGTLGDSEIKMISPPAPTSAKKLVKTGSSIMKDAKAQLEERGKKLKALDLKTSDLKSEAAKMKNMASQMKKKAQQQQDSKLFGMF